MEFHDDKSRKMQLHQNCFKIIQDIKSYKLNFTCGGKKTI